MPKGPQGQKRPADVIGNAVRVMDIATGQAEEEFGDDGKDPAAKGWAPRAARPVPRSLPLSDDLRLRGRRQRRDGSPVRWFCSPRLQYSDTATRCVRGNQSTDPLSP